MELDTARELSDALRAIAANQRLMHSAFNRWKETTIEEEHFEEIIEEGLETLDVALDAQRRRAQSEVAFYNALTEYNKSLALAHRRMGTILVYNSISMAEGPWAAKAYQDAFEYSRRRGASHVLNYGWTRPGVVSMGPVEMAPVETGGGLLDDFQDIPLEPSLSPEEIPTPAPVPGENRQPTPAQPIPSDATDPVTLTPLPGGTRAVMTFSDGTKLDRQPLPALVAPVQEKPEVQMTGWVDDFEPAAEQASQVIRRATINWDRLGGRAQGGPSQGSKAVIRKMK